MTKLSAGNRVILKVTESTGIESTISETYCKQRMNMIHLIGRPGTRVAYLMGILFFSGATAPAWMRVKNVAQ